LGAVVSKYIGETEKNLRRVFAAAKKNGAVLFFDEADALFGKRTELKDSHDRYVNIEINYLLQRIEKYGGVAILAAGNRTKIDNALSQWFHFVIRVPPRRKSRRSALAM
jgi:SpoVK/Ycf46/Vps4 family AAA+-type ATPase